MPALFPDTATFVACCLIITGAQFIYATVGFGAGMFAVALLAMVLPDLKDAVATLLLLTLVTEIWVLAHAWRHARLWLLLGLLPTMALGMWLGTQILVSGDVGPLKRALGAVVAGAGIWFAFHERRRNPAATDERPLAIRHTWTSLPAGLISGLLAGTFGTGGPPVIIYLKGYGLDKSAFRATLLWYFLIMSAVRGGTYLHAGVLGGSQLWAAVWLLPATVAGILAGMLVHQRLSERHFGLAVALLLVILGALLLAGVGQR